MRTVWCVGVWVMHEWCVSARVVCECECMSSVSGVWTRCELCVEVCKCASGVWTVCECASGVCYWCENGEWVSVSSVAGLWVRKVKVEAEQRERVTGRATAKVMVVGKGMGEGGKWGRGEGRERVNGDGEEGKDMHEENGDGGVVGEDKREGMVEGTVMCEVMVEGKGERRRMHERNDKGDNVGVGEGKVTNRPVSYRMCEEKWGWVEGPGQEHGWGDQGEGKACARTHKGVDEGKGGVRSDKAEIIHCQRGYVEGKIRNNKTIK